MVCDESKIHSQVSTSLGKVFAGYDIISGEDVAIKFEPQSSKYLHLENEYNAYKSIGNHIGLPRLKWFGQENNQRVLVLSLLRAVLAIANQMVFVNCLFVFILIVIFQTSFHISTLDTLFTAISSPRIFLSDGAPPLALFISLALVLPDRSAILEPLFMPLTKRTSC